MLTIYQEREIKVLRESNPIIFILHKLDYSRVAVLGSGVFTLHLPTKPTFSKTVGEVRCDSRSVIQETRFGFLKTGDMRAHSKEFYTLIGPDPSENFVTLSTGLYYCTPIRQLDVDSIVYRAKTRPLVYYANSKMQARDVIKWLIGEIGIPSASRRSVADSILKVLP